MKACNHPGKDCLGADLCCGECAGGNHAGCSGCRCPHVEETVATFDAAKAIEAFYNPANAYAPRAETLLTLYGEASNITETRFMREALTEIDRLVAIEQRADEVRRLRDKNGDENPHEGRRAGFYILTGRWPTW